MSKGIYAFVVSSGETLLRHVARHSQNTSLKERGKKIKNPDLGIVFKGASFCPWPITVNDLKCCQEDFCSCFIVLLRVLRLVRGRASVKRRAE